MPNERHIPPRLWDPLGFFRDFQFSGPLAFSLFALAIFAAVTLCILVVRGRITQFFSLPLPLALIPFVMCSFITNLRFYAVLGSAPPGATIESGVHEIASIQYPFQFGIVSSLTLLLLHTCAYGFQRQPRNA